jgi:hypothetical protein
MSYAKGIEINFFSDIWADGHDLARKKLKFRFFVKFDQAAKI